MKSNAILIIEDDENKLKALRTCLADSVLDVEVHWARSYNSGLRFLLDNEVRLVLMDMSLPSFDVSSQESGGRARVFGGRELFRQMARKGMRANAIMVTQYDRFGEGPEARSLTELERDMRAIGAGRYSGTIFYSNQSNEWKGQLVSLISECLRTEPGPW